MTIKVIPAAPNVTNPKRQVSAAEVQQMIEASRVSIEAKVTAEVAKVEQKP